MYPTLGELTSTNWFIFVPDRFECMQVVGDEVFFVLANREFSAKFLNRCRFNDFLKMDFKKTCKALDIMLMPLI